LGAEGCRLEAGEEAHCWGCFKVGEDAA
jgi:hypothetical protein